MNAALTAAAGRTFAALQFRNYRLYLTSMVISFSGTWMQMLAQSWLVLELTGSGTALGTVTAAQFLPTLLLAPYGGTIADRLDKRKLIMVTQAAAGFFALTLGIVTLAGVVELWMVYVLAAGYGMVTAVDNPSRQTFVMEMVGPEHVSNAVTLNSVTVNAARAIGPAIGGLIIATVGVGLCFVINAVSYLAVITALFFIRREDLHPAARGVRSAGQIREGFRYVARTPILRTTLLMLIVMGTFAYKFNVTLPMLAELTFGAGAGGLAWLTTLMGGGAVLGGLVIASSGPPSPKRLVITAAVFGASLAVLGLSPSLAVAYAVVPFVGACSVAIIALSNATLQLNSDPRLRGRVMSMFSMSLMGSNPIGGPLIGWIGDHTSASTALLTGSVAAMAAAGFGAHQRRRFAPRPNTPRLADSELVADVADPAASGLSGADAHPARVQESTMRGTERVPTGTARPLGRNTRHDEEGGEQPADPQADRADGRPAAIFGRHR